MMKNTEVRILRENSDELSLCLLKRRFHEIFKNVNKQKLLAFSRIESYSLIRDFS